MLYVYVDAELRVGLCSFCLTNGRENLYDYYFYNVVSFCLIAKKPLKKVKIQFNVPFFKMHITFFAYTVIITLE